MKEKNNLLRLGFPFLLSMLWFWLVLFNASPSFSQYFRSYSPASFLIILVLYYFSLRLPDKLQLPLGLGLTMALFALPLAYKWTSGFSDNMIIGGLLPYKDSRFYYFGANLILHGLPMVGANQATERPLFPGFLSSVLLLTGQNLKIATAIIVQLMGIGMYMAARYIRISLGVLAASLYAALLYFYIQPWIGYLLSESLGFAAGCFAFTLTCLALYKLKWYDLVLALITLVLAVSARAGAFFIFPMLVIWIGWVLRGKKTYSLKWAGLALALCLVGYFLCNSIYGRFLGIPPGRAFKNFSYALYGQVRGGAGWNSAIAELGTRDSSVVYRAAWEYFREHPSDLLIGIGKAYKDFFLYGGSGVFPFYGDDHYVWLDFSLWLVGLIFTGAGVIQLLKDKRSNFSALWLASFVGVFLSIPFLPPVDGGTRFHASTMPFFFAVPAMGLAWFSKNYQRGENSSTDPQAELGVSRFASLIILFLTLFLPLVLYRVGHKQAHTVPVCTSGQKSFVIEFNPDSYIDLVQGDLLQCGSIPEVCLQAFQNNNDQKSVDDFYQRVFQLIENTPNDVRLIAGFDLVAERLHYYFISHDKLPENLLPSLVSGCAARISTLHQTIFYVETILPK